MKQRRPKNQIRLMHKKKGVKTGFFEQKEKKRRFYIKKPCIHRFNGKQSIFTAFYAAKRPILAYCPNYF
jgi:hypothetical protein